MNLPRKGVTKRELAEVYKVSLRTVDGWIAQKKIPVMRISPRLVRFDLDAVARALERFTIKAVK